MDPVHSSSTACRTPLETRLLWAALVLLALALFGPALPASPHQHGFADQRVLWGLPCALDVLSNLPFALAGAWGLALLRRLRGGVLDAATRATATLFCAGLLCTTLGSAWYHLRPDDAGLLWDRLGMAVAFAGLLGLAAASRVSARAGQAMAVTMLLAGPLAVAAWARSGNLLPWAVVQFGGMLVVLALACLPRRPGALALNLFAVIAWYGAAKACEAADAAVFAATGQWLSGHSLKHLCAAGAALPVLWALRGAVTARVQNGVPAQPQPMVGACRSGA
ncbi:MAG: hypothetical protein RBS27_09430 [Giesbergeria sp.]|jgi:hypothetical protein|nr:hypothetical protein [Giesbergeria sp.]